MSSHSVAYAVIFRTHKWDEDIDRLAKKLAACAPSAKIVILYDETNGPCPELSDHQVIRHTTDSSTFDIPNIPPGRSLWWNGDYALYFAHAHLPNFDYYVMSEFDVAVNTDLDVLVGRIAEAELDLVAHAIRPSTPDWLWHSNGATSFAEPMRSLIMFTIVSQRALVCLLKRRQEMAKAADLSDTNNWPYCETFIPSVIAEAGFQISNLGEWTNVDNLNFRPQMYIEDRCVNEAGSISHPVLGRENFIDSVLSENNAMDYFREDTVLNRALNRFAPETFLPKIEKRIAAERDNIALSHFYAEVKKRGMPVPDTEDLAFCKPALSSSISQYSASQSRVHDAAGANGSTLADDFGFHTAPEDDPWWQVDLQDHYVIDSLKLLNRRTYADRFRDFSIESSVDSSSWISRYMKCDGRTISNDPQLPLEIRFSDPFYCRYVRVRMMGNGMLHLRRVQVFGRRVVP